MHFQQNKFSAETFYFTNPQFKSRLFFTFFPNLIPGIKQEYYGTNLAHGKLSVMTSYALPKSIIDLVSKVQSTYRLRLEQISAIFIPLGIMGGLIQKIDIVFW